MTLRKLSQTQGRKGRTTSYSPSTLSLLSIFVVLGIYLINIHLANSLQGSVVAIGSDSPPVAPSLLQRVSLQIETSCSLPTLPLKERLKMPVDRFVYLHNQFTWIGVNKGRERGKRKSVACPPGHRVLVPCSPPPPALPRRLRC